MASINQIQKSIIELEGGKFQRLVDALIAVKGVTSIFSIGTVIGTDKTRTGTPDTMTITGDEITFIEYSTKQERLFAKFQDDISKCLDAEKTGISTNRIKKIVLAYNGRLTTNEISVLMETCKKSDVSLEFLNIETISYTLFNEYPGLIVEFLGLSIDTGQVVSIAEFIKMRDKNILAAKLSTTFVGRHDEKDALLQAIKSNNVTIISGRPGLGKTRLALECCEEYAKSNGYNAYAILDKGVNIFDDLQIYFSAEYDFLILVDDANKVSNYEYFIDLILHKKGNIKLVVTVRDYAKEEVIKFSKQVKNSTHFELGELKKEDIEKIITANYPIRNSDYIDRIIKISSGNTRLAIMASELAIKENRLDALNNVFELYDAYYSDIIGNLSTDKYDKLIGFAGIISFIKIIDFEKAEEIELLNEVFNYTTEELEALLEQLHLLEIVDAYENTIYKVSDQVLSSYLFYYVFMHKNILDISDVFNMYFFKDNKSVVEIINSVASSFLSEELVEKLKLKAKKLYISSNNNEQKKIMVLKAFGGLLPNEVLQFFKDSIDLTQPIKVEYDELVIDPRKNSEDEILRIATTLRYSEYPIMKILFQLILVYVNKDNSKCNEASLAINYIFGLNKDNIRTNYQFQKDVIEWFVLELSKNDSAVTKKIFIEYCRKIIKLKIEETEWESGGRVTFIRFVVPYNEFSVDMRRHTINRMFSVISNDKSKNEVIKAISAMYDGAYNADITPFLNEEMGMLHNLLKNRLKKDDVKLFVEVSHLLDMYVVNGIESSHLEDLFEGKLWELYLIIMPERLRRKYRDLSYDKQIELKDNLMKQYVISLNEDEALEIAHDFFKLYSDPEIRRNIHNLQNSFERFLVHAAGCSNELILKVLNVYFLYEIEILYRVDVILNILKDANLIEELYSIIESCKFKIKRDNWLLLYLEVSNNTQEERFKILSNMFETVNVKSIPNDVFYYLNVVGTTDNEIVALLKILMDRAKDEDGILFNLDGFFSNREQLNYSFMDIYSLAPDLIGKLYKKLSIRNTHFDYKSKFLEKIILNDSTFISGLVSFIYSNVERHNISRVDIDFDVIWKNLSFADIELIIRLIVLHDENKAFYYSSLMKVLFETSSENIKKVQLEFTLATIERHNSNEQLMVRLFDILMEKDEEYKLKVINCFLKHNTNLEFFMKLSIDSKVTSWSGSAVPVYQRKIDYLNKILNFCDTIDLINHREYIKNLIDVNEARKENEKKRDFRGRW